MPGAFLQVRDGETYERARIRREYERRLLDLANAAECEGVILELHRVPCAGSPLAQGNHEPQVIAYTNHRL